ncbi:MAG: hypothetical protein ABIO86_13980 [Sphingomonas sp.]
MEARAAQSVGLGGDGDEIAAITEVETEFGVTLDYTDAENWASVGDVYAALRKALPPEEADKPGTWARFAQALCRETGISPSSISLESELLAESGIWIHVANGSAMLWSAIAIAAVVGISWMLL